MATAIFNERGIAVVRDLLKAPGAGLDKIRGGSLPDPREEYTLVWEDHGWGKLRTTNSMATNNALIFQYPASKAIIPIVLRDSDTGAKTLTLVLQTGTIQSDTIKFLREIVITLDEPA
jgi:hypothetical protein